MTNTFYENMAVLEDADENAIVNLYEQGMDMAYNDGVRASTRGIRYEKSLTQAEIDKEWNEMLQKDKDRRIAKTMSNRKIVEEFLQSLKKYQGK